MKPPCAPNAFESVPITTTRGSAKRSRLAGSSRTRQRRARALRRQEHVVIAEVGEHALEIDRVAIHAEDRLGDDQRVAAALPRAAEAARGRRRFARCAQRESRRSTTRDSSGRNRSRSTVSRKYAIAPSAA